MVNKKPQIRSKQDSTLFKRWLVPITVILLLTLFAGLSLIESSRESATSDEVTHIPAGISYVQTGNFRMNIEHPVLIKYLSGLSVQIFSHARLSQNWSSWKNADEWRFGRQLLYLTPKNNADKIVFWGRLPILIIAIGLGLVIFFWGSSMYGSTAGLAALAFYSLDPTMIAYSHLVTFDLSMAAFVVASAYCLWLAGKRYPVRGYILTGLFLGLALVSKISSLSFAVLMPLFLLPAARAAVGGPTRKIKFYLTKLGLIYGATFVTIWLTYLIILRGQVWHKAGLLPAAFVSSLYQGLVRYQLNTLTYLDGHLTSHGEWWYYPGSFLAKSTLVVLLVLLFGLIYVPRNLKRGHDLFSDSKIYILAPIIIFGILAMISRYDLGLRTLFIIFPFIFILIGYLVSQALKSRSPKTSWWLWAAAVYYGFTIVSAFPNYLAYSNELFGGRTHSYRYLADSNLDWGQGLKQLKIYAAKHNIKNLQIIYYGEAVPEYYGFRPISEGIRPVLLHPLNQTTPPPNGWLAVSTSNLNYSGLHDTGYLIDGTPPKDLVAGSILLYKLPSRP